MSKVVIIGIDGMDRELVAKYRDSLPTFNKIINENPEILASSVFPPDSDTAWASIYTGLNPAKHGVVDFVDPLEREKINKKESEYWDRDSIKGKTFWDIAKKAGKKSCVIYPHIAFPVWDVNGFMINPNPETEKFEMHPKDFKFNFDLMELQVLKRIPRTKLEYKKYLNRKRSIVENEFEFAIQMLKNYEWDLFFFYTSALDSTMHIFWNYCDSGDPTYPGKNPFDNALQDFHILHDKLLSKLLSEIDEDTSILIFSDHGHSMRPVNLFNINEVLRQNGYLIAKGGTMAPVINLKEQSKRALVDIAQKSGLRPLAQTVLRMFPKIKNIYTKPSSIDFTNTIAHCTDLSGMKSYTYGGIKIQKEKLSDETEYERIRAEIINLLREYKIPETGEKVVKWVCKREDLYQGKFLHKYPDIVFDLREDYGAGWAINLPAFTVSASHKFFPGSHRGATPVFYLINRSGKKLIKREIELMDIAPTILELLEIKSSQMDYDGKAIVAG